MLRIFDRGGDNARIPGTRDVKATHLADLESASQKLSGGGNSYCGRAARASAFSTWDRAAASSRLMSLPIAKHSKLATPRLNQPVTECEHLPDRRIPIERAPCLKNRLIQDVGRVSACSEILLHCFAELLGVLIAATASARRTGAISKLARVPSNPPLRNRSPCSLGKCHQPAEFGSPWLAVLQRREPRGVA
jgi:hypothetical protein